MFNVFKHKRDKALGPAKGDLPTRGPSITMIRRPARYDEIIKDYYKKRAQQDGTRFRANDIQTIGPELIQVPTESWLQERIELHQDWIRRGGDGTKLSLSGYDLSRLDFSGLDLRRADFSKSIFTEATFAGSNLTGARFSNSTCIRTEFSFAILDFTKFDNADMRGALMHAVRGEMVYATGANLSEARINGSELPGAVFAGCNLSDIVIQDTVLAGADYSGSIGLLDPSGWMQNNFERVAGGYIVYKAFGSNGKEFLNKHPAHWKVEPGAILTETPNYDRSVMCACGVNFGTDIWMRDNTASMSIIWECLLKWEDMATLVVPYSTDGKARCGRLELVKRLGTKRDLGW